MNFRVPLELRHRLVAEVRRLEDFLVHAAAGAERLAQLFLEPGHLADRHLVEVAVVAGVDRDDLLLEGPRLELRLVQGRDHPLAAAERLLRGRVELGAELCERLQLAELRQVEAETARDLLHRLRLERYHRHETEITC
jgi:hypothetical protein